MKKQILLVGLVLSVFLIINVPTYATLGESVALIEIEAEESICTIPTDGMEITESTTLCQGVHLLPRGIIINSDNVELNCNGAFLNGSDLQSTNGIFINGLNNISIKNCTISDYEYGIRIDHIQNLGTSDIIIENNHFHSNHGLGILAQGISNSTISSNLFTAMDDGMSIDSNGGVVISNNNITISDTGNFGIELSGGSNYTITNNYIKGRGGINLMSEVKNSLIINNEMIVAEIGLEINGANANTVRKNNITSRRDGIYLTNTDIFPNLIENNLFIFEGKYTLGDEEVPFAILLETGVNNHTISNNTIKRFPKGIDLFDESHSNLIYNNTIINSTQVGIRCEFECFSNLITRNNIVGGHTGILLESDTHDNILSHNRISSSIVGINISAGRLDFVPYNNSLINNTIKDTDIGVFISSDVDNESLLSSEVVNSNFEIESLNTVNTNTMSQNMICNNNQDIFSTELDTSYSGDGNTCDTTKDWNDLGTSGCTFVCSSGLNINSFNYSISGKIVEFFFDITGLNFDKIIYIDHNDKKPRERKLCSKLKDGICEKRKVFRTGEHNLTIMVLDDAGNSVKIDINFVISKDPLTLLLLGLIKNFKNQFLLKLT